MPRERRDTYERINTASLSPATIQPRIAEPPN
jgi:hypothetical protein